MPLTVEEQRLVMKVVGEEEVRRLTRVIEQEEQAIRNLSDAQAANQISHAQFEQGAARAAQSILAAQTQIGTASRATRDFSTNITAAGYALNDFFSANGGLANRLAGVSNNLPGVLSGFGQIGLALSVLLPAIGLVATNWENLVKFFGDSEKSIGDNVDTIKERIKELEKQPVKLAVDIHELEILRGQLEDIQKAIKAVDAMRHTQDVSERSSGKKVQEAIENSAIGGAGVEGLLRPEFIKIAQGQDKEISESKRTIAIAETNKASLEKETQTDEIVEAIAKEEQTIAKANQKIQNAMKRIAKVGGEADVLLGRLLDEAANGHGQGQVRAQEKLASMLRGGGQPAIAADIEDASPAAEANRELLDEMQQQGEKSQKEADRKADRANKEKDKAKKADDDLVDALNRQGIESTEQFYRERDQEAKQQSREDAAADRETEQARRKEIDGHDRLASDVAANTNIDESAFDHAQQLAQQGRSVYKRRRNKKGEPVGRPYKAREAFTDEQIEAKVRAQVVAVLRRNGMDFMAAHDVASNFARNATAAATGYRTGKAPTLPGMQSLQAMANQNGQVHAEAMALEKQDAAQAQAIKRQTAAMKQQFRQQQTNSFSRLD